MTRSRMVLNIVACLSVLHAVQGTRLSAQRPIDTRRGNITPPVITRPVETTGAYQSAAEQFRSSVSLATVTL